MVKTKYIKTLPASLKAVNDILVKEKPVVGVKCLGCEVGEHGKYHLESSLTRLMYA